MVSIVFLRLQAAALMLLFLTATLVGQLSVRECLCSGEVSLSLAASATCSSCCLPGSRDGEEGPMPDDGPSPCEKGDCFVFRTFEPLNAAALLDLRPPLLLGTVPEASSANLLSINPAPPAWRLPSFPSDPPARSTVSRTVLYRSFLI